MFLAGLLFIIRKINSVYTAIGIVMRCVDWLLAGSGRSWSSWWWAASVLETCRGLLL